MVRLALILQDILFFVCFWGFLYYLPLTSQTVRTVQGTGAMMYLPSSPLVLWGQFYVYYIALYICNTDIWHDIFVILKSCTIYNFCSNLQEFSHNFALWVSTLFIHHFPLTKNKVNIHLVMQYRLLNKMNHLPICWVWITGRKTPRHDLGMASFLQSSRRFTTALKFKIALYKLQVTS